MRDELPNGTVTFLFSDVEGSTKLLHEHGAAYAHLLADHRIVVRAALARRTLAPLNSGWRASVIVTA